MVVLDEKLLRKRSEHNEGLLVHLEEISLHQQELERIECIGNICKNIRILLLQNNIIERIENLRKLKRLEYINLALNNICRIEGLNSCESLRKLDLTLNFIDFDALEESLKHLIDNYNLEDLYLVGNPIQTNWADRRYRDYVILACPQIKQLDGILISPAERIAAQGKLENLEPELRCCAARIAESKRVGTYDSCIKHGYTRQARIEMYRELGEQKAEKERMEKLRLGIEERKPREPPSVLNQKGEIRQCNEGGYEFSLEEDPLTCPGHVVFQMETPRFMDISLIDIDLNPLYVRCSIRGQITQIRFDCEVVVARSRVERSKTTGAIKCICPIEGYVARSNQLECIEIDCRVPTELSPPPLEQI
jgi:protein TilB